MTAITSNNYGAITIFSGFFPTDPLPTRVFCRNMAKIVQLLLPGGLRFEGGVIERGDDSDI
jgi:hypothetical protein